MWAPAEIFGEIDTQMGREVEPGRDSPGVEDRNVKDLGVLLKQAYVMSSEAWITEREVRYAARFMIEAHLAEPYQLVRDRFNLVVFFRRDQERHSRS